MNSDNIGILIILFNPSNNDLESASAIAEHYKGVIVDNSDNRNYPTDTVGRVNYIPLHRNTGIANAQNVGLRKLLEDKEIKYIVFFDQDSRYLSSYPEDIVKEYIRINNRYPRLALLGPTVIDSKTGTMCKTLFHPLKKEDDNGFIRRRDVISSGSVVASDVLMDVGLMLECLFIDYVDYEWCWRAENKRYICGQSSNIVITHSVGNKRYNFMGYVLQVWSSFRYFYQFRNYVWLSTLPYTPRQWKLSMGIKSMLRLIYFPFLIKGGAKCWLQMCRGLFSAFSQLSCFRKEIDSI